MNRIIIIAVLFLGLGNQSMLAQRDIWTLDACIEYAVTHNLTVKDLSYATDTNKESYRQSLRELLPTVSGSSNYFIQYGRSVDPNTNAIVTTDFFSNNYGVNASIDIFRGFQKWNTIKSTKLIYQATKEEALQEKYLLAFRVMSAFYDVQFFKGLLQISKDQVLISKTNYELVQKRIELGLSAGADLYEAESLLIADQLEVTQSENNLKAAMLTLVQEMNLENTTTIEIESIVEDLIKVGSPSVNAETIYNKSLAFIPAIKAQELRVNAAKKDISIAKASLYPSLTFDSGFRTGFFETNTIEATGEVIPFNTQISDNSNYFVGASLRVPIFERWSSRSRVKQQKIAFLRAENTLNIQKQQLNQIIQELVQTQKATSAEYKLTQQNVSSSTLAFEIAQKRYDKGLITVLELNQAKNALASAQNSNLQAQLRLKVNLSTLQFYEGSPIFNIERT